VLASAKSELVLGTWARKKLSYHDPMRAIFCATIGLCLIVVGCHHADPYAIKPSPVQEWAQKQSRPQDSDTDAGQEVALLSNAFAFDLFRAVDNPGQNICTSPLGVMMTLSMVANGANGETQKLILNRLGDTGGVKPLNTGMRDLMIALHSGDDCPITLANSVWTTAGYPPSPFYVSTVDHVFGGNVNTNLRNGNAGADAINDWTNEATGGLIDHAIDHVSPNENVVIENAAAFRSRWLSEFDPRTTRGDTFTLANKQTVQADFMNLDGKMFPFVEDAEVTCVMLPYKNEAFDMVLAQPTSGTADQFLAKQTWETWGALLGKLETSRVSLKIPRWKSRYQTDLLRVLPKLGLGSLLKSADLSGISPALKSGFVSQAVHGTYIEVDEQGTKSAANTDMSGAMGGGSSFKGDHPFAYAIIHKPTGAILFLGVCNDPTKGN
jgi:serine protease inhibitor